ncbi:hypothetical protein TUM12370_09350 [Salmonella enterica subsp. enterica serovar Choleraesuis]|nr:hypothetical protein TUM12370_09350 [Salmonella enterica subsp. enterica serovar Choleraesuis]
MEFTLKDSDYRVVRLSVFDQLRVARKLLPLLAGVISELKGEGDDVRSGEGMMAAIARAVSELSEDDCNAIIHPCLSAVARKHQGGWVAVFSQGSLAFDDIDLMTMLQLVARVVADSLGNFLQELPGNEKPAEVMA